MTTMEINTRALYEAIKLIGGDVLVNGVVAIYDMLDRAEKVAKGYDAGFNAEAREEVYKDGYEQGFFDAENPTVFSTDECQCESCRAQDEQDKRAGFDQGLQDYIDSQSDESLTPPNFDDWYFNGPSVPPTKEAE